MDVPQLQGTVHTTHINVFIPKEDEWAEHRGMDQLKLALQMY